MRNMRWHYDKKIIIFEPNEIPIKYKKEYKLSDEILAGNIKEGDEIQVDVEGEVCIFNKQK